MVSRIPYKLKVKSETNQNGFTLFELILVVTLIMLTSGWLLVNVRPAESSQRARDNKRLASVAKLETAILNYQLDNSSYPGISGVLYQSHTLPIPCSSIPDASCGWIEADLSSYTESLPVDPLNDETYHISYITDGSTYELSVPMEYLSDEPQNDGGNDPNAYETGNNLNLISP